jgi:hypothetical protein
VIIKGYALGDPLVVRDIGILALRPGFWRRRGRLNPS